jgi:hypothetical protein
MLNMRRLFILLLVLFISQSTFASHAAVGEITYSCLGPNQYQLPLQFYRDCVGAATGGVQNLSLSSASFGMNGAVQLAQVGPPVHIISTYPSLLSTCNGGPIQGIEQYTYQGILNLPLVCREDWFFSWSVCCRNNIINNLIAPIAQRLNASAILDNTLSPCNTSPAFNKTLSAMVCINQQVVYNHGVSDADDDW